MSQIFLSLTKREPRFSQLALWLTLFVLAWTLLAPSAAGAQVPVVIVPVVTDPTDAPRLLALAKLLRAAMADRGMPTVAARYTATLEEAKATGDAFAAALDLTGEFATLRYDLYSDELVRTHTLRLIDLAKAPTAILLAAPMANRIVLKRVSRADGQSIALPDPCEPKLARQALEELLPPDDIDPPAGPAPETPLLPTKTRKSLLGGAAVLGVGAATVAVAFAARRRNIGTEFQNTAPTDSDYLPRGDDWRARRAPMLASASVAAASLSLAGGLFATHYDQRKLRWVSIPAAAVGTAALAWAVADISQGAPCTSDASTICVHAERQLDRGILLALLSAPAITVATTHLGRWIHEQIRLNVDASPHATSVSVAYRH